MIKDRFLVKARTAQEHIYTLRTNYHSWVQGLLISDDEIKDSKGNIFKVDEETICQCTEFRSIKSELTFEGDKIKTNKGDTGVIENLYGCYGLRNNHEFIPIAKLLNQTWEIIGNIHKNKNTMEI